MEYVPLSDYNTLWKKYFLPLESAVLDHTVDSKICLLRYYASIIRRWGSIIRTRTPRSALPPLAQVISRAELLCLSLLESPESFRGSQSTPERFTGLSVLSFYMELASVYSHASTYDEIRLTAPLPQTMYILAFTPACCYVSLLSAVLAKYKSSFEDSLTLESFPGSASPGRRYPTALVDQFNGYVMDMCNLLWRNRGLNAEDPNAKGCLIPAGTADILSEYLNELNDITAGNDDDGGKPKYLLGSLFSFGYHVAMCGLASACFRDIETQAEAQEGRQLDARLNKPVTQRALTTLETAGGVKISWQEFRLRMLDWLDERGAGGIGALMRVTMKTLRKP
jgi:centromere protein I